MKPSKSRALIPFTLNGALLCVVLCSLLSQTSRFLTTVPAILFGMEPQLYYDSEQVPKLMMITLAVVPLFAWAGWVMLRRAKRHVEHARAWLPLTLESLLLGALMGAFFFGVRALEPRADLAAASQVIPVMVLSTVGATLSSMWLLLGVHRELS